MIVQADFADGEDLLVIVETSDERKMAGLEMFPLMGMNAGGHEDEIREGLTDLQGFPDGFFGRRFDGAEEGPDARGMSPGDDGIPVGVEVLHVDVGVGVDPDHVRVP